MNNPPEKPQPLRCIIAVPPNVVLRDLGVKGKKAVHRPRFRENVRRVAQLRSFNDNRSLNVENVFVAKQIDPTGPA